MVAYAGQANELRATLEVNMRDRQPGQTYAYRRARRKAQHWKKKLKTTLRNRVLVNHFSTCIIIFSKSAD